MLCSHLLVEWCVGVSSTSYSIHWNYCCCSCYACTDDDLCEYVDDMFVSVAGTVTKCLEEIQWRLEEEESGPVGG